MDFDGRPRWIPRSVFTRPRAWLLAIAAATIPFAWFLPRLEIRTDGEALYPAHNAVVESSAADRKLFRDPEAVIVLVSSRAGGPGIFTPAGLAEVAALTRRLQNVPGVRQEDVLSLSTVYDISASVGSLRLTPMLQSVQVPLLRDRLEAQGIYSGLLYGRDGRSTAIYLPMDARVPRVDVVHRLREALRSSADPQFEARLTGPVVAEVLLGENIVTDLKRLLPLVIVVVVAALLFGLRSAAGALVPMLEIGAVMTWTFGAMAMAGVPLTLVTSILPVLLMAMAVTDQIHVIERLQTMLGAGLARNVALARTYAEVGAPIARTAITTALGFLSFTTTSVPAMRHFGLFACLGLMLSMVFSFTLIPAVLALIPDRWLRRAPPTGEAPRGFEAWAAAKPRTAALIAAAGLVAALVGISRLQVQDSWVRNFHPRSDLVVAERQFNQAYWGSYRLDVTLEGPAGFFRGTRGFQLVDSLERRLARDPDIGGVQSMVDLTRVALRGVNPDARVETLDDAGLTELLMMLEMMRSSDMLDRLVTPTGEAARVRAYVRGANYARATRLISRVDSITRAVEVAAPVRARVTGDLAVATQVVQATVSNQVRSIAATVVALLVFLAISFRSIGVAVILLLPVVTTSLMVFGGMGYAGVPLGVATSMFAALAEGEGVNYTIHIVSRFLEQRREHDAAPALRETLQTVGPAVRWNGVALISGCLILCLSTLAPVRALGALLAVGMTLSYALAFLVLPVFLLRLKAPSRRSSSAAVAATAVVVLALALPALARAARKDDPRARAMMTDIERSQRAGSRLFSMTIDLSVAGRDVNRRLVLGLARGDARTTHLLYVYAWPRLFRGSTLVIEDAVAPADSDHIWIGLPGLSTFREVEAVSLSMLVPGTGLTYEDARGWITPERYDITFGGASRTTIVGVPKSDSLARVLGNARIVIQVDPAKRVVTSAQFFDAHGQIVKTYDADAFARVDGRWYPERVHTRNVAQMLESTIAYQYRALPHPPPLELFRFEPKGRAFMDRLLEWRDGSGLAQEFADSLASVPAR